MNQQVKKENQAPCKTCPFLRANYGKPNPEGYDPNPEAGQYDWYTKKNLLRIWNELRRGEAMVCHDTDPNASFYGGKDSKPGIERVCIGSLAVIYRHAKAYEKITLQHPSWTFAKVFSAYRKKAGKYPMTREGIRTWLLRIFFGNTKSPFGLPLPTSLEKKGADACGFPWEDPCIDKPLGIKP